MAPSDCRAHPSATAVVLALLAVCGACAMQAPQPEPQPEPRLEAGIALPEGQGRELLVASCLSCHDLGGLELFKRFYTRDSWRALVLTMVEHGAVLDAAEIETLADYLAQHFGVETSRALAP